MIRSSDIVALMSEYEANPVALMEALALGRKIVVADTSGLTEIRDRWAARPQFSWTHLLAELAKVLVSVAAAPEPKGHRLPTWDQCVDELLRVYAETVPSPG